MNQIHLIGRLTSDPQFRATTSGDRIATFRLAVPRLARGDDAMFVSVTCFGGLAQVAGDHLTRGRRVALSGRLDQYEWTDSGGGRHEQYRVVADHFEFLDSPDRPDVEPEPASA